MRSTAKCSREAFQSETRRSSLELPCYRLDSLALLEIPRQCLHDRRSGFVKQGEMFGNVIRLFRAKEDIAKRSFFSAKFLPQNFLLKLCELMMAVDHIRCASWNAREQIDRNWPELESLNKFLAGHSMTALIIITVAENCLNLKNR